MINSLRNLTIRACLGLTALLLFACARGPATGQSEDAALVFPPPPAYPRVQYLGYVSSPRDLPSKQGGFADFVLGREPLRFVPAKPNNALLSGSKLFIGDTIMNTVFVYDLASGDSHPLAGDRGVGKIQQPNNLAMDENGRLYVADMLRRAVLVYGPDERFITAFGREEETAPVAVAVGPTQLFVADLEHHEIEIWDRESGEIIDAFGGQGSEPGQFNFPTQTARDSAGNLFVTDTENFRIQKFSPDGQPLMQFGSLGTRLGQFAFPKGLDVDGKGRIYVADARFANVQIFNEKGDLLLFFGGPGPDRGNLDLPSGVRVYPWPDSIQWLESRLADGIRPEFLVIVVNQQGQGLVNFFAVNREPANSP